MTAIFGPGPRDLLDQLRAAYPRYAIDRDTRRDPVRYHAVARDLAASLCCVVTTDLDELGRELAATRRDPAAAAADDPAVRNRVDDLVSELASAWPEWEIWTVHRAIGGPVWCARRKGWRPGMPVFNAGTPEDLAACLEGESRRGPAG